LKQTIERLTKRLLERGTAPGQTTVQAADSARTDAFFAELAETTGKLGSITHSFADEQKKIIGYVQLHRIPDAVILHRIWTLVPRQGHGSIMLNHLCNLADRHAVQLQLKVIPLGTRPYPLSAEQLRAWYCRHGFKGGKTLIREPSQQRQAVCS
jgi:hypothetical protein